MTDQTARRWPRSTPTVSPSSTDQTLTVRSCEADANRLSSGATSMALMSFSCARLVHRARGVARARLSHFLIVRSAPPVSMNGGGSLSSAALEPGWGRCRGRASAATLSAWPAKTAAQENEPAAGSISHRRASLSFPAVASHRPDQSQSRASTVSVWPRRTATSCKVDGETSATFSELVATAMSAESGGRNWRSRI